MNLPTQSQEQVPQYPSPLIIQKGDNIYGLLLAMVLTGFAAFFLGRANGVSTCKADIESRFLLLPRLDIPPVPPMPPMPKAAPDL